MVFLKIALSHKKIKIIVIFSDRRLDELDRADPQAALDDPRGGLGAKGRPGKMRTKIVRPDNEGEISDGDNLEQIGLPVKIYIYYKNWLGALYLNYTQQN